MTGDEVAWQYTHRRSGVSQILASVSASRFRFYLARWATFAGADLFCAHKLFAVRAQLGWPHQADHRFSLFLCNEPTMGFWFKLYLYSIDGVFPPPSTADA